MRVSDAKIIVIGGDHHNMLGVVRSLGMRGCNNITAIITNDKTYSFVSKSRYIKNSYTVKEEEGIILDLLKKNGDNDGGKKAIIIPTSDFAACLIDKHLNELSDDYIIPSINGRQGEVVKYMDKYNQFLLAKEYGVKMAECNIINLNEAFPNPSFSKCIVKPLVSANGNKIDITICDNADDYFKALEVFRNKQYDKVLVQEYVDFDRECGLIGCSGNGLMVLPGIIKKNRIYPISRGSNSYSNIEKVPRSHEIIKILKMLKELGYSGLFDIEIFVKGDEVYLNEINFRNSGNAFAYCYDDIYLAYIWIAIALGENIEGEKLKISAPFSFVDERLEMKQLLDKNISFKEYIKTKRGAKAKLLHFKKDIKPSIYKYLYIVKRRVIR